MLHSKRTCRIKSQFQSRPRLNLAAPPKTQYFHEHPMVVSLVHCEEVDATPHDFNSSFHKREEAPEQDLLFDVDLDLTYFGRWMSPILCSQNVSLDDIAVFTLPK